MIEKLDLIARAKAYVAASNAHDLKDIKAMLANHALYQSSGVGEHAGNEAIIAMMSGFFAANPDVHWQADDYQLVSPSCVQFSFLISMAGQSASGTERIDFASNGAITKIEVMR